MREIKFRAWDIGLKQMFPVHMLDETGMVQVREPVSGKTWWLSSKDKCHLMQFTGLRDKNGREVYEGDIVLFGDNRVHGGTHGLVEWIPSKAGFFYSFIDGQYKGKLTDMADDWRSYEVMGNLYQNPDLLK